MMKMNDNIIYKESKHKQTEMNENKMKTKQTLKNLRLKFVVNYYYIQKNDL